MAGLALESSGTRGRSSAFQSNAKLFRSSITSTAVAHLLLPALRRFPARQRDCRRAGERGGRQQVKSCGDVKA